MGLRISRLLVFVLLVAGCLCLPARAASIDISAVAQSGSLQSGFDPFFWANVPLAVLGTMDTAAVPSSCGVDCAFYEIDTLNLLVDNSQLYPVSNPGVVVVASDGNPALYQLSGTITVSGTYVTVFALALGFPAGVIGSPALLAPPTFAPTTVDSGASSFLYQIVAGGPSLNGTFGLESGVAAAAAQPSEIPEPFALGMTGAGLLAFALARRRSSRNGNAAIGGVWRSAPHTGGARVTLGALDPSAPVQQ